MSDPVLPLIHNGGVLKLDSIPLFSIMEFREIIINSVKKNERIVCLFSVPELSGYLRLYCLLANDEKSVLTVLSANVSSSYPSLTPECVQAHLFERVIAEKTGVIPEGHPWLKPVRSLNQETGVTGFFKVGGDEIHEVAVGPVHAGIIEPGHFRFQCHGETVFHLEISLGYQHRGIEQAVTGGPDKRTIHYMETAAGDTSIGHGWAYCQLVESLSEVKIPNHAQEIRSISLELERMANHIGDLGALAGDIGYLPTASYCGRIRGDILNITAIITGNRFGRRLIRPGGVAYGLSDSYREMICERLNTALKEASYAISLLWEESSVLARFEGTGILSSESARMLGIVGPAARASNIKRDIRFDFPYGIYRFEQIPAAVWKSGDVFARAYIKWLEILHSGEFVKDQIKKLSGGSLISDVGNLAENTLAVSLIEGWRGEIAHIAITDEKGRFSSYSIIDPSFHNWAGLAMALRGEAISDFPLCNKSFNLSYCGHDL